MSRLYEVLGVAQHATCAAIKNAYRAIVLRHHPDKSTNLAESEKAENEAITKAANGAWEVLRDPQRRKEYDELELRTAKRQKNDNYSPCDSNPGYESSRYDAHSNFRQDSPRPPSPPSPPRTLNILLHDWALSVMFEGEYEPYEWGLGRVYCEENRILIYMKIRKSGHPDTFGKSNVGIKVETTPEMQRNRKIESLYKHRMQPDGVDELLLLTVFLEPDTKGEFTEMEQYDCETRSFEFSWDVNAPDPGSLLRPPPEVVTHGTCLNFFTRRPCQMAMFVQKPCHPDNPRGVLLRDSDLKPDKMVKLTGTAGREQSWITLKGVTREGTRMYQLAACGWQSLGQGKGEREKAAADAKR